MVRESSWHRCHKQGWGQDLVPEAYSHPAKVARGLARKIYAYVIERGWLKEGDICLDPFAGIGGFALDAMFHGLHFIGCELEEKFVQLGQQNIDLWNRRYGGGKLRRWGTATILQGDSRRLVEVLEGARAEGLISSPPFSPDQPCASQTQAIKDYHAFTRGDGTKRDHVMRSSGNIADMPTGELPQAVISSPSYAKGCAHTGGDDPKPEHIEGGELPFVDYGSTDGQLAAMREGDVDAVIASPPWLGTVTTKPDGEYSPTEHGLLPDGTQRGGSIVTGDYGQSPGQLAALPEGEPPLSEAELTVALSTPPQAIVSSPPYEGSMDSESHGIDWSKAKKDYPGRQMHTQRTAMMKRHHDERRYGSGTDNLGNQQGDTFWSAARAILLQCHQVLAPGGVAIWVVKDFVRNKKRVDFTGQWRALCESCGFETIEVIKAWLVEERGTQYDLEGEAHTKQVERKSFFRRLYEFKARAAKFWESVSRDDKAGYLWRAHGELWRDYYRRLLEDDVESPPPLPTRTRILSAAQSLAYREAGEPDVEIDTQIDYEVVLVTRANGLT